MIGRVFRAIFWLLSAPFRYFWLGLTTVFMATALGEFLAEDPEDVPVTDTLKKVAAEPKDAFNAALTHLSALRNHIKKSAFVLIVTTALAFTFFKEIMAWLVTPIGGIENLEAKEVTEPISVFMRVSVLTGFTVAMPYILFEILRFFAPGISRKARIIGLLAIPFATLFFIAGLGFAYFYMLPTAISFMIEFGGIPTIPTPASYIRFTTGFMFWTGAAFQLPLVSYTLAAMKLLQAKLLKDNWRIAFILLAVLAAFITPTPDAGTMLIVLLPLWALYGFSIVMAYIGQGSRAWRKAA